MSASIISRRVLIVLGLLLFSQTSFAVEKDGFSCKKPENIAGLQGAGTEIEPYVIPVNTCVILNGNSGQQYWFNFAAQGHGDRLQVTASSQKTTGCNKDKLTCLDTQNTPSITLKPLPEGALVSNFGGYANITAVGAQKDDYSITVSSKAEVIDFSIANKGLAVENNYTSSLHE